MSSSSAEFTYRVVSGSRIFVSVCSVCHRSVAWSAHPKALQVAERAHVCGGSPVLTILVVDDYAPHAYALTRSLGARGFQVITAATGTEALERAAQMPDLVLLDVGLPDVNGFEVCRRIKANPKTAGIPVVFISATHQNQESVIEGDRCGASAFLFHPITPEELLPVIQGSVLKARQAKRTGSAAPGVN